MSNENKETVEAVTSFNKVVANLDELTDNFVKQAIDIDNAHYQTTGMHFDLDALYYHAHSYSSEIYTMFERNLVTRDEAIKILRNHEYFKSDEHLDNIDPNSWSILYEPEYVTRKKGLINSFKNSVANVASYYERKKPLFLIKLGKRALIDQFVQKAIEKDQEHFQEHGKHLDIYMAYQETRYNSEENSELYTQTGMSKEDAMRVLMNNPYFQSEEFLNNTDPNLWLLGFHAE